MSTHHPSFILIRGLPGSGKSYLTTALAHALGDDTVTILDPDSIDYKSPAYQAHSKALSDEGVDEKFHPHRFLRNRAWKAIDEHKILIWNQPFMSLEGFNKTVTSLIEYAREHNTTLPILLIEMQASADIAHQRVKDRKAQGGHGPSHETFQRFVGDYVSFAGYGFPTVTIDGNDEVSRSVATVMTALNALQ